MTPAVLFFADSNGVSQETLYTIEAHVTRNLSREIWISVDARARFGAETSTNGVDDGNEQSALALGATIGASLSPKVQVKATYGSIVARNADGPNGDMFRAVLVFAF